MSACRGNINGHFVGAVRACQKTSSEASDGCHAARIKRVIICCNEANDGKADHMMPTGACCLQQ